MTIKKTSPIVESIKEGRGLTAKEVCELCPGCRMHCIICDAFNEKRCPGCYGCTKNLVERFADDNKEDK